MDEIVLTPRELEEIKDDVKFKTNITRDIKHLHKKIDKLNGVADDVKSLKIHRVIHWFLISVILGSLLTMALLSFTK